jgi:hypothetical protein
MLSRSSRMSLTLALLAAPAVLCGCSSDDDPTNDREKVGEIRQNQTWKNGDKIVGVVSVFEGATLEIEPGAVIGCTPAAKIQVGGTLRVKAGARRAKISCPQWTGILVAANGRVELEGIDLENPEVGIDTTKDAGEVTITDSSIIASERPFRVGEGTTVRATNVRVTTPTTQVVSVSEVYGTFIAKRLDYEANANEGIMAKKGGVVDIEDSTLKATGGYDLVSSYGGKSVKIRYTTMSGAHCGPHIDESKDDDHVPTGSIEIDHVTSEQNIYGITIYAASPEGPHTIKDSNFIGISAWLDLQGPHGPIHFQNVYSEGNTAILGTEPPAELTKADARIEAAKPR